MELQCNVCKESPVIEVTVKPKNDSDLLCCPSCDKQLAFATYANYGNKFVWNPIDTEYNESFGGFPVIVISK